MQEINNYISQKITDRKVGGIFEYYW